MFSGNYDSKKYFFLQILYSGFIENSHSGLIMKMYRFSFNYVVSNRFGPCGSETADSHNI